MARKGWDALSPAYRQRMERNGVTRDIYESGGSIQKARGHQATPERPERANAENFPDYFNRRQRLVRELAAKKQRLFHDRLRYDAKRSRDNIRELKPSMSQLQWAVKASEDELLDALRDSPETFAFLGYH